MSNNNNLYVYEAFCGAFYRMPTIAEFLGETDTPEGRTAFFHLGEKAPKDMRVSVILCKDKEAVIVRAEWRNYSGGARLKGSQDWTLPTYALSTIDLTTATEDIAVRVLELFKQVLEGTGVAGKIDQLVESEPS